MLSAVSRQLIILPGRGLSEDEAKMLLELELLVRSLES